MRCKFVCGARCQANYVLLESHRSVVPTQSDVMMCVLGKGTGPNMGRVGVCVGWGRAGEVFDCAVFDWTTGNCS